MKLASCSRLSAAFLVLAGFLVNSCFAQTSIRATDQGTNVADQQIPAAVAKKLEAMEARIEQLEAELKARSGTAEPVQPKVVTATWSSSATATPAPTIAAASTTTPSIQVITKAQSEPAPTKAGPGKVEPFSDADWTWLNGNPRTKEIFWDTKFFTPEIRADTSYVFDFNHPTDHS